MMGILSVHRNLLSNCKSQLKYLSSSSSNLWFIRRISKFNTCLSKAQSHAPTADLKSNNNKLMLLIENFHGNYYTENSLKRSISFPPYNYSIISAENSWKEHHNFCNPFSRFGNYTIDDSCNELMLIFFYNLDAPFTGYGKYILWNPTIDKIKILPPPGPAAFRNIHGFGFDSESEDYKVIRFPLYRYDKDDCEDDTDHEVKLYSLKTNSWKKIACPLWDNLGQPLERPRVHINGVYYWGVILRRSGIILSFDFANEKFSSAPHIPLPPKFDEHNKGLMREFYVDYFALVEFDGSLAAVVHSNMGTAFSFQVWGWNGESWLEKVPRTTIHVPGGVFKVLGLFQGDKLFLQSYRKGEVLLFDLPKSKLENLGIHAELLVTMVNIFPFNVGTSIL